MIDLLIFSHGKDNISLIQLHVLLVFASRLDARFHSQKVVLANHP